MSAPRVEISQLSLDHIPAEGPRVEVSQVTFDHVPADEVER